LKLDLTKMNGKGGGTVTFDLNGIVPAEASLESHSEMAMSMNNAGQKQAMSMKLDLNLQIESK